MAMIWRFAFPRRAERHIAREPLSEVKFVVCVDRGIVAGTRNGNVSQSLVNAFLSCLSHVHVHQNALSLATVTWETPEPQRRAHGGHTQEPARVTPSKEWCRRGGAKPPPWGFEIGRGAGRGRGVVLVVGGSL